jgi:putative ABC transport system permease protein
MVRVTMRNLLARKLRLALSAFAIVLGVAFVSGSFIFTDALGGAFNGIIKGTTADVEVAPKGAGSFTAQQDTRTIAASVVRRLAKLPQTAAAHGVDQVQGVYVIGANGKLVGGNGPPGLAFNYGTTRAITGDQIIRLTSGQLPSGMGEVALDESTAEKAGYSLGDRVTLVTPGKQPLMHATLTGLVHFGSSGGLVGATLTIYDQTAIQQLFFGGRDVFTGVSLTAADGVSQDQLAKAANKVLPPDVRARSGDAVAKENQDAIGKALGFINTFLLVFAAVAMVVGTFLIINTFSILVAQRSRELALLRAMGASKGQVNRSVLTEAFVVGLIGSTIGIGLGYLLALGLRALFAVIGLDLGSATFPLKPRTIAVSYAVGVVVTMIAAYLPARRAARIAPVAAMRDEVALPESSLRRRMIAGASSVLVGIALMVAGFRGSGGTGLLLIGGGMLLILVGVALMSPVLGRPVILALGALFRRVFGTVGALATQNSLRNPRRTAATASALMIGLTLVALMSILGQSAKASTDKAINDTLTADFVVSNAVGTPFSTGIADRIRQIPGVQTVAQFRSAVGKIDGDQVFLGAADPTALAQALKVKMSAGAMSDLANSAILVDKNTASSHHYALGDQVALRLQAGVQKLTVAGVFSASAAVPANYLVTLDTLRKGGLQPADSLLFITKSPGAETAAIDAQIAQVIKGLPTVTLKNQQEFADEQSQQINTFLYIIYALLGLAIIIAVLGIVNTLALSVIERTREVGLLRAVGLSRRQLRRMVRLESVAIAVLGAVLGVIMGVAFGIVLQRAIADQGIDVLSIPGLQLAFFVLVAALVGVLAAVLPARRAARLNVLDAITTQ